MNELLHDIELLEKVCKQIANGDYVGAQIQLIQIVSVKEAQFKLAEKQMLLEEEAAALEEEASALEKYRGDGYGDDDYEKMRASDFANGYLDR